jgi:uncharacterized membrane protein
MTIRNLASRASDSIVFYPLSAFWVASSLAIMGVAQGWFRADLSIIILTLVGILLLLLNMHREVTAVHQLVNSQRDELVERIEQLVHALHMAGAQVPRSHREDMDDG